MIATLIRERLIASPPATLAAARVALPDRSANARSPSAGRSILDYAAPAPLTAAFLPCLSPVCRGWAASPRLETAAGAAAAARRGHSAVASPSAADARRVSPLWRSA